ncbi:MAG: TGS domain-containing protein [Lysobacterales bacterium]|jgi:ribosome-interacting GTPase 1|nr:MAG: TGS domain-containing protein [Xanthomonadales bacterium]
MPANLSPEYKAAAEALRRARDPEERLGHLREMLRVIPKHKGTDHLQADLKRRIKELDEELAGPKRGGARGGPPLVIRPEGAAQVALVGPPNSGKSLLHHRLTGSGARSGPYAYTTQYPEPGMLRWQDVSFQLVDLPPVAVEHPVPWLAGALQTADGCLLVVDLADPDCVEQVTTVQRLLAERRVSLVTHWPVDAPPEGGSAADAAEEALALRLPTLLVANQADRLQHAATDLEALAELEEPHYPTLLVSAQTGLGLGDLGEWLWRRLGLVRVYTKAPGKPPDGGRPYTLRHGEQTVADAARLVHRDLADSLKFARVWGSSVAAPGQHVGREHRLADRDVLELHS